MFFVIILCLFGPTSIHGMESLLNKHYGDARWCNVIESVSSAEAGANNFAHSAQSLW